MARRTTEYRGLSSRARRLLGQSESVDVEFKRVADAIRDEDLVAFANSAAGGVILAGVREVREAGGQQRGDPVGCPVGDGVKLKIMNRAMSCVPPIHIDIILENSQHLPFYRVEVPSGTSKPYCTGGGDYKIRADGRIRPLHPEALLAFFLQREAEAFRTRFLEVTGKIEGDLRAVLGSVGGIKHAVDDSLQEISSTLHWTDDKVDDTSSTIDRVDSTVNDIDRAVDAVDDRVLAILEHLQIVDPVKQRAKKKLAKLIEKHLRENPSVLPRLRRNEWGLSLTPSSDLRDRLDPKEMNEVASEVVARLREELAPEESNAGD